MKIYLFIIHLLNNSLSFSQNVVKILVLNSLIITSLAPANAGDLGSAVAPVATQGAISAAAKPVVTAGLDTAAPGFTDKIGKFLSSPPGIMIVAGIGGLNAMILYNAAGDQEKESEENIKKIDKMLLSYKDSWSNFCPNGREKLEEPDCYCYLDSGKQNTARSNSQICKNLWAKNKFFLDSTASSYANLAVNKDPSGCMTVSGQFDESCKCKKFIDAKGSNACMKSIGISISGNALGGAYLKSSGVDKVMTNAISTLSGSSNIGNLSDRSLALAIAKQGDLNNALFEKLNKDPKKNMFPKIDSNSDIEKFQGALFSKSDLNKLGAAVGGSALGMAGAGNPNAEKAKILDEVQKKLGLDLEGSGKGLGNKKAKPKAGMDFNFNDSSGTASAGQVLDNFPEKSYKYKNSDITTDESASIFEIISNRYVQSGLRRLFDDGEVDKEPVK